MSDYFTQDDATRFTKVRSSFINGFVAAVETAFGKLPALARLKGNYITHATAVGGTANAVTLTLPQPISSYTDGLRITFPVAATNTGAATVDVDSVGAVSITRYDGTALEEDDMVLGSIATIVCVGGTRFQLEGRRGRTGNTGGITGGTLTADLDFADYNALNVGSLTGASLKDTSAAVYAITGTSGAITVDYENGHVQTLTVTGPCTFTFTNWPATGDEGVVRVLLTNGSNLSLTDLDGINWRKTDGTTTTTWEDLNFILGTYNELSIYTITGSEGTPTLYGYVA